MPKISNMSRMKNYANKIRTLAREEMGMDVQINLIPLDDPPKPVQRCTCKQFNQGKTSKPCKKCGDEYAEYLKKGGEDVPMEVWKAWKTEGRV